MGQYYKGEKIGTCESMYYMRLSQAQKLASIGAVDDDKISFLEYCTDGVTRFRFPFPDEDGVEEAGLYSNGYIKAFDRGFLVPVPDGIEINHTHKCAGNTLCDGTHNVNMFIPCIYSEEFKNTGIQLSSGGAGQRYINIMYKAMRPKIVDGKETKELVLSTLFECARCGQLQRVSNEEMARIKEMAIEHYSAKYRLVAQRDLDNEPLVAQNKKALDEALETINRM